MAQLAVAVVTPMETSYPLSQVYVTIPLNIVLVGVPEDALETEGGVPQSMTG